MRDGGAAAPADRATRTGRLPLRRQLGNHPSSPITLSALGVDRDGNDVAGAAKSAEDLDNPGYADTWTDLSSHTAASDRINVDNPTGTVNRANTGTGGAYTAPPQASDSTDQQGSEQGNEQGNGRGTDDQA